MEGGNCLICGAGEELAARAVVTFRKSGEQVSARVVEVHTCGPCRARMVRSRDARDLALAEGGPAFRRLRSVDVAGAMLVIAIALAIAAATGWLGGWAWWVAVAYVLAIVPVAIVTRRVLEQMDARKPERWESSPEAATHAALESELRAAWRRFSERMRDEGWETAIALDDETRASIDEQALVDPRTWAPPPDGAPRYVVHRAATIEHHPLDRAP